MKASAASGFRFPFLIYSEQEALTLARACPNGLFVDAEFPPNESSLFVDETRPMHPPSDVCSWQRPNEIHPEAKLFIGGADDSDVMQGALGDCWFLAALCVVARRTDLLQQLFVSCHPEHGFYQIRFWKESQWVVVTIDDRIPCGASGLPLYASGRDKAEMWVPLVEKAYAKLHGCYEALQGGSVPYAFVDLTAGVSEDLNFESLVKADQMWERLSLYIDEEWLVGAASVRDADTEELSSTGLLNKHAYGILKVVEVDGEKLIQMRNPWGQTEWNGKWSDQDPVWSGPMAAKLGHTPGNDGLYWMNLQDFVTHFNRLYGCRLYQDEVGEKWCRTAVNGEWKGASAGGCINNSTWSRNPQYSLCPTVNTQLFVSLVQHDSRLTGMATTSVGIILLRTDDVNARKTRVVAADVVTSCDFADTREVSLCAKLEANKGYVVIPSTFRAKEEGPYVLSIYTDKPCRVQTLSDSGSVQELAHEDLDFSKGSGLSDDALAALGICDISENRHALFPPYLPRPAPNTNHKGNKNTASNTQSLIDQFASILDHATVLPYHVLSPVLQHSSFRSDLTPPPATSSEFIYTHPAYRKLCALDPAALARVEAKHPVLGPVIENITRTKSADTSHKTRPNPATNVDKAKEASASASASANEEEEDEAEGKRPPVVSARASRAFSAIPVVDGRAMVTLLNGDVYQGETKDGKKHGYGVYRFKNGDCYDGNYVAGEAHGRGKFSFANGTCYEGDIVMGYFEGQGKFTFANGAEDRFHGKGKTTLENGGQHLGAYRDDKYHGKGVYRAANGDVFMGLYKNGAMKEGELIYANGDRYKGLFKHNRPSGGAATLTYANKCTYRGEFKKGLIHGYGEMTFPNGDSYIGNWNAGLRHGNGTYKRANGDYYVGDYVKGERHGKGELMEDGDRYEGDFANGHPHGRGTYHTGARYEGDLRDGEPDGHGTFRSADGSVYTGDFVGGQRHGRGRYERANGATYEGQFVRDVMEGHGRYVYPHGDAYEGAFAHNKFHGRGRYTFAAGGDPIEGLFADGKPVE